MGTSLIGLLPQNTYSGLIKVGNNTALNTTLKTLSDGAGNDLPMQASTTGINFTGTVSGVASGVAGAIQFSNGSAFASDAANLFWDDTNNRLGIGTNTPTGKTQITESFTTTGNNYSAITFDGTLTSRATASDTIFGFRNTQSIIATATGQTIIANDLTPNYTFFDGNTNSIALRIGGLKNTQNNISAILMQQTAGAGNNGLSIGPANSRWEMGYCSGQSSQIASARIVYNQTGIKIGTENSPAGTGLFEVRGSGSTSATTSLLVQNSAGTAALTVKDDCSTNIGASGISAKLNIVNINGSVAAFLAGSGNGGVVEFNSISGAGIRCNDGYGNTNMFLGGLSTPSVSIGKASSAVASALLEMVSTTKGFLPPVMTTTQKNAIASPAEGLQMYDSTAKSPAYYDGTNWGYTGGALQNAAGNSGTLNISFAAGNIVNLTLNATTTLAFSNAVIGTYIIQVTQGATGANLLTYPASVKWAGGTPPTLSTAVGKTDILTFYYDGTFYYGNYSLNY